MMISAVLALFGLLAVTTLQVEAQCVNPGADLLVGFIVNSNQYLIAQNLSFINGRGAPYTSSLCQTTGSGPAFTALASGSSVAGGVDVLSLTVDNMINRQLNKLATLTLVATLDNQVGNVIVATNGVTSFAGLKGKNIAVDAVNSGYVYEFQSIAQANGLLTTDYNLVALGGTSLRYNAMLVGSAIVNGVNVTIDCTILIDPFTVKYATAASLQPIVLLANVNDYLAPLAGTGITALAPTNTASLFNNATKQAALVQFLQGTILANFVLENPNNAALVQSILGYSLSLNSAQAAALYLQLQTAVDGAATVNQNLHFSTLNLLNTAYLRQRLGGFNSSTATQQNLTPLLSNGPGQFIDYTLVDQAYAQALAIAAITVNVPTSISTLCVFNNFGVAPYTISNAVATIGLHVSGGCSGAPTVQFASCTSTDVTFAPSQCTYNSITDSLSVAAVSGFPYGTRVVVATYVVNDLCGSSTTINQTISVVPLSNYRSQPTCAFVI